MTILAAVDENERSKQVVSLGYDLAKTYGDTLAVLHVVPTEDYRSHKESLESIPGFGDFSLQQEQESAEQFARQFATQILEGEDLDILDPRGRVGTVSDEILAEAEAEDPRFLVISGRRRSPAGKAIFGNTAQRLLLNATCPVVSKLSDN